VRHIPYVVFTGLLWGVGLRAVLIADEGEVLWRDPVVVTAGVFLAAAGLTLVTIGARHLTAAGVGLFGIRPGGRLVTDGPYAVIRNPIDVGTTLLAVAVWLIVAIELSWVIPVAALVSFVAAYGPYEDRLLLEEFEDEFEEYRGAVRKWLPLPR
jgi:protein-S-isoprenylcysteine O-methyltransferase Ste14